MIDERWYEDAIGLVQRAQDAQSAAFVIHTLDDGGLRLVGLSLPAALIAGMLRTAAKQYEAQVAPDTLN